MTTAQDLAEMRRRIIQGDVFEVTEDESQSLKEVWPETQCVNMVFCDASRHYFVGDQHDLTRHHATSVYLNHAGQRARAAEPQQPMWALANSTVTTTGAIRWSQT